MRRDIEEKLIELLAEVYSRIPWHRMRTSKNPHDIWNHRLYAASTRGTLGEFVTRLCSMFSIQSVSERAAELLQELRPYEADLLDIVHREHIPLSVLSALRARELKKKKQRELFGQ